jgi:hypothetical protein
MYYRIENIFTIEQLNQLCVWSTAEIEGGDTAMSMESSLPEEPQLISAVEHEGSVTDIKVDNMLLYADMLEFLYI